MPNVKVSDLVALNDVINLNHWEMEVIGPELESAEFNTRAVSTSVPSSTHTNNEIKIRGHVILRPGDTQKNGQIDLQVLETIDNKVGQALHKYSQKMWKDDTGRQDAANDLFLTIKLNLLDNTREKVIKTYNLKWCLLNVGTHDQLGPDGTPLYYNVTINYTDYEVTFS